MSQCARVALFVPTVDPVATNKAVLTSDLPDSIKAIPTHFGDVGSGGGGSGGIEEAPINGKQYARVNAGWAEVTVPTIVDGGTF